MPDHVVVRKHPGRRRAHSRVRRKRAVDRLPQPERIPSDRQEVEVERLLHLVGPDVPAEPLGRRHPRLGDEDLVRAVLGKHLPPSAVDLVDVVLIPHRSVFDAAGLLGLPVGEIVLLDQAVCDVDAEAVDSAIEPEPEDPLELVDDLRIAPVEVGLGRVEEVEIPLTVVFAVVHTCPSGSAERRLPVVRRQLPRFAQAVAEQVSIPCRASRRRGERLAEPRVRTRRVVRHQVDQHTQTALVRAREHPVELRQVAESGIDIAVVGDVVTRVRLRRRVERREPQRIHPELREIAEMLFDAQQVAHPIAIAIGERARIDLIDHRVPPPIMGRALDRVALAGER